MLIEFAAIAYNKQLAKHFARQMFSITWWMFPQHYRTDYYYYLFYRVFLYFASVFCFASVALYVVLIIRNI